jgi:hypothetical protein
MSEIRRFRDHGLGVFMLYLFIKWREGIQKHAKGKNKNYLPITDNGQWVRVSNNPVFFTHRQAKYRSIQKAEKLGLIECMKTGDKQSPLCRILEPRENDHNREFGKGSYND